MPHIVIEVSPSLLAAIDWAPELRALHIALADRGWAALADLKSRVTPIAFEFSGADRQAQQLVATLILTQPRPAQTSAGMAELVFEHLCRAVGARPDAGAWVQCCVFLREHPRSHYLKRQWNAPL
ncbi:MAG: hypothetical protein ABWY08_06525 [Comamonas sp.]